MLLGYPIAIRRDVFLGKTGTLRTNEMNFYVRDEWRVSNKLRPHWLWLRAKSKDESHKPPPYCKQSEPRLRRGRPAR